MGTFSKGAAYERWRRLIRRGRLTEAQTIPPRWKTVVPWQRPIAPPQKDLIHTHTLKTGGLLADTFGKVGPKDQRVTL